MAIRTISGSCEITTGVYTESVIAPLYQGESGLTEFSVSFEEDGEEYAIPETASVYMYFYYDETNTQTSSVEMTVDGDTASVDVTSVFSSYSGRANAVIQIIDGEDTIVSCRFPQYVHKVQGTSITSYLDTGAGDLVINSIRALETMPTASADLEYGVVLYVGTTTETYENGTFYICQSDGEGGYEWSDEYTFNTTSGTSTVIQKGDGIGGFEDAVEGTDYIAPDTDASLNSLSMLFGVYEAVSEDPDDPADGHAVIWMSDGTDTGDAGDILIKVNIGSTVKTITLFDYSAGAIPIYWQ